MEPFESSFELPDGVTYGDIGRVLVHRTPLRNALDPANGIIWSRDIFKKATVQEIQTGLVEIVNLMDPNQTGLMELTLGDLNCIAAGGVPINLLETSLNMTQGMASTHPTLNECSLNYPH